MNSPAIMTEKGSLPTHVSSDLLVSEDPQQKSRSRSSRSIWYHAWRLLLAVVLLFTLRTSLWSNHGSHPYRWIKDPVTRLLKKHPLIDGHNDLLIFIRGRFGNKIYDQNFTDLFENGGMPSQFDLPRAEKGHLGGAFWSAWVPCPANGTDFSDENYAPYVKATLEQIDLYNRLSDRYPRYFTLSRNAAEAERNFYKENKLISPLAIEGLHQIGNSLATLRLYHTLGVRYATLTWNCHNKYADAAIVSVDGESVASKPLWGGVSPAGRDLILEMNRLGMIVDLSHVSVDTMRDVLGGIPEHSWTGSRAPVIFSHSSAKAICPHPRNVPDDVLQLVKQRKSLVMVNFAPDFISCRDVGAPSGMPEFVNETNTIDHVVEHIMHIGRLIGFDHVGFGSDFDGIPSAPRGLDDVSKYPDLVAKLMERGVRNADIGKVVGGNLLRVWHEVDRVAARLQRTMTPVEDDVHSRFLED